VQQAAECKLLAGTADWADLGGDWKKSCNAETGSTFRLWQTIRMAKQRQAGWRERSQAGCVGWRVGRLVWRQITVVLLIEPAKITESYNSKSEPVFNLGLTLCVD
jgi:hypothetical protein